MKKLFKIITPILVLSFFTSSIYGQSDIFQIEVKLSDEYYCYDQLQGETKGNILLEHGVGFLLNGQYIITAYHVVAQHCSYNDQPTELEITVIDNQGKRYKVKPAIFKETLFDIAILELPTKLRGYESYTLSNETLRQGNEVEIKGCNDGIYYVKEPNVVIPGVYGSHKLAASVDTAFDVGCSGSPVLHNGKVVGMAISKNDSLDEGYFIHANIIEKAVRDMTDNKGEIQRVFTGTIWKEYNGGVVLEDLLHDENGIIPRRYIGQALTALNSRRIRNLSDLRSAFELSPVDETIRFTFDNGEHVNVEGKKRSKIDLENIFNYYDDIYMKDYSINSNQYADNYKTRRSISDAPQISVEELVRMYGVNSPLRLCDNDGNHYDIDVIKLNQFKFGIGARDIYDLGLIIKTFSPTIEKLILNADNDTTISIKMPGVLFN